MSIDPVIRSTPGLEQKVFDPPPNKAQAKAHVLSLADGKDTITIGRSPGNDIVLPDPLVSRVHAVIERVGQDYRIVDLESRNGTRVNGERVQSKVLCDGDEVWIGTNPLFFDRSAVSSYAEDVGVQLEAIGLTKIVGKGTINLNDISLSIKPGELVCIVGGSGAGKTTLLNALSGSSPATEGQVLYNDIDYYDNLDVFRASLGYVPQDDIVHAELTVYQTLYFAARLRLPRDTEETEIETRITSVLNELGIAHRREEVVRNLSGGQRKRVSIAVELLARPSVFFLDEPTSGLDPSLDGRMMKLLRALADGGRTIVITTHATRNIALCNKVVFMVRGGHLAFFGTPDEALAYFGVDDLTDIYEKLESNVAPEVWAAKYRISEYYRRHVQGRLGQTGRIRKRVKQKKAGPSWLSLRESIHQLFWLSARYISVLRHDPLLLALLLIQAPIIAAALSMTFSRHTFALRASAGGNAREGIVLLFNLAVASIWLGASNASRALTEEIAVYRRERLINLKIVPYIASKLWVLGLFSLVQSGLLIGVVASVVALPDDHGTVFTLFGALALTNVAGLALGLLVSAVSKNSLQATAVVVILIIPQLILAGASVPLSRVSAAGGLLSSVMLSRWSLSLMGHAVDINTRLQSQVIPGTTNGYHNQFSSEAQVYALILAGFAAVFVLGTVVMQRRR